MSIRALLRAVVVCGGFGLVPQLFASGITNPTFTPCGSFRLSAFAGNSGGCTVAGAFTLSGFQFSASAGAPLNAMDITVNPTFMAVGGVVVSIDLAFGTFGTAGFRNTGATDLIYTFDYILDPARPIINGAGLSLDPGGTLMEDICAGGTYTPDMMGGFNCTAVSILAPATFKSTLFVFDIPPTPQLTASTGFFPPNVFHEVDYHLILDLPPGATAGGFNSSSITALPPGDGPVPEPSSALLGGAGLLGLLGLRSRAKLRQVALKFLS